MTAETKLVDKDRELLDANNKTHEAQIQAMEQDLEKAKSAALKKAKDDESKAEKLASDLKDSKEELVKANAEIGSLETSATDAEERHTTALKVKEEAHIKALDEVKVVIFLFSLYHIICASYHHT